MKRTIKVLASTLLVTAACLTVAPTAQAADLQAFSLGDEPTEISVSTSKKIQGGGLLGSESVGKVAPEGVSLQPGDNVWANGSTGNDANPGTEEYPVKTFARAKELMEEFGSDIIWVTGALQVSGTTETWDLNGKMIMRDGGYRGALVEVTDEASLTLQNIVIDGGLSNGAFGKVTEGIEGNGASLVDVDEGTLSILGGAKLQNNRIVSTDHWYPDGGGGVFVKHGTLNLDGGTISGNSAVYGGGICAIYDSTVNVYSGEITGNRALKGTNSSLASDYGGCGGGICVYSGADVNVFGGVISDNTAFERGGGISVGCYFAFYNADSSTLQMTGGTIKDNSAGSSGAGIFVQAGLSGKDDSGEDYGVPGYSIAHITAGDITGNTVTGDGYGSHAFGGGGIYVNGYTSALLSYHNGELYLENAVISDNTASLVGGGYAGCPASNTVVTLENSAVFFGNKTDSGEAREVYVLASSRYGSHSGDPLYDVSPSMLGGGAYRWLYDDGTEVPLNKLSGTLSGARYEELRLSNALDASDAGVQRAVALAKVHIMGNSAPTRGGGIGTNGSVFIGRVDDETTEVGASKNWLDADDKDGIRPDSVIFELYRDDEYVGYHTVEPNDNGVWETTFTDLPKVAADGHEYVYTVKERTVEGYASDVEGDAAEGFTIFNTRSTSVDVSKKWDDGDNVDGRRPTSVTVDLLCDGEKVDSAAVEADDNGSWSYTFADLAKYDSKDGHEYVYTVKERAVDGYTSKVVGSAADGFTVTNTHKPAVTSVEVTKEWVGAAAKSATVKLQASDDGGTTWVDVEDATAELTEASGWKAAFRDLPACVTGEQGVKRVYRVVEDSIDGYTTTYKVDGEQSDGSFEAKDDSTVKVVVTNTKNENPPTPEEPDTPEEPETPEQPEKPKKELPQTGDSSFAGFTVALVAGVVAFAYGASARWRAQNKTR